MLLCMAWFANMGHLYSVLSMTYDHVLPCLSVHCEAAVVRPRRQAAVVRPRRQAAVVRRHGSCEVAVVRPRRQL